MKVIYGVFFGFAALYFAACNDDDDDNNGPVGEIEEVASASRRWTGIAVSPSSRVFANYPNWSADHTLSVVELVNGNEVPYPNEAWNAWMVETDPAAHFICVQSVFADRNNRLWVLDPANAQRNGEYLGVVPGGAKLVQIDLQTNSVVKTIVFEEPVIKRNSYLNDIRIDEDDNIGYITDSNEGALIVVDLASGKARRVLDADPSTKSENEIIEVEGTVYRNAQGEYPVVHADGIALSPDRAYLYWRALTAKSLYRIETRFLRDETAEATLSTHVENLGTFPPSDGMIFGQDGKLYLTSIEENAVRVYEGGETAPLVVKDDRLKWPDSFAVGADGALYVTTSQIHIPDPGEPYRIFKFYP